MVWWNPFGEIFSTCKSVASIHQSTWGYLVNSWRENPKGVDKHVEDMNPKFKGVSALPIHANLVLNSVVFNVGYMAGIRALGFSNEYVQWNAKYVCIPQVVGSMAFYAYKYGLKSLVQAFHPSVMLSWVHNMALTAATALPHIEMNVMLYAVTTCVQPFLPASLQGPLSWPLPVRELYFQRSVYVMWGITAAVFATLPIWMKGYEHNMKLAGRKPMMSYSEMAVEVMYLGVNQPTVLMWQLSLGALVEKVGCRFLKLHYFCSMFEFAAVNFSLLLRYEPVHRLQHRVPPLYRMTHLEHHVCKSIHPNTSGSGTWEVGAAGGNPLFFGLYFHGLPYVPFFIIYFGLNLFTHYMGARDSLVQWHTAHHLVLADIYGVNVPSGWDVEHSKDYQHLYPKLEKASLFVKHLWLSDAVGGLVGMGMMAAFHYGLGWSLYNVWDQRIS